MLRPGTKTTRMLDDQREGDQDYAYAPSNEVVRRYWGGTPKLSAWIALDDARIDNGCMKVVPDTHGRLLPHQTVVEVLVQWSCHWPACSLRQPAAACDSLPCDARLTPGDRESVARRMACASDNNTSHAAPSLLVCCPAVQSIAFDNRLLFDDEMGGRDNGSDGRWTRQVEAGAVDVPLQAGDVLFFHDLTVHASHPNVSGDDRCEARRCLSYCTPLHHLTTSLQVFNHCDIPQRGRGGLE